MSSVRFAVHAHSAWSYDGRFSLRPIAHLLASLGYRGVLMSEHDRGFDQDRWMDYQEACVRASSSRFLVVPGIEYSSADNAIHVPVWGSLPFLGEGLDTTRLLDMVAEHDGTAVLAHPSRNQTWRAFQADWAQHLLGVEVWNVKEDGYAPSAEGIELWRQHPSLVPFADLDLHTGRQLFPLAMELRIDGELTRASVHASLRNRTLRGFALGMPVESFTAGVRRQRVIALERGRYWAFRRIKRVVKGHY